MGIMVDIDKFKRWLQQKGCEILPPSNEYEALRFKGSQVGVIYTTGRVNGPYVDDAIYCFQHNTKWGGGPVKIGRHPGYKKQKQQLISRDGTCCFYCGREMEDDITVEHLIALSCGGKNELSNMVLAHEKCNQYVANMPISKKVEYAIKNRRNENNRC